jgi:predicted phage terminase large subunit-like protein
MPDSVTPTDHEILQALLREDLASFVRKTFNALCPGQSYLHNWHIEAIAYELMRVARGEVRRLLITLPPRSLKSICASVAFPAWVLGHNPTKRIICVSYANDLTARHARDFRTVVLSDWYQPLFPLTRACKDTELEFVTTREGYRYGTSIGGTLTGRGGSLIIIDDPLKPEEALSRVARDRVRQWFDGTLYPRLDDKARDSIVLVMQRLHLDDLAGYLLEKGGWHHLNLPAIAVEPQRIEIGPKRYFDRAIGDLLHPERETPSVLEEAKANLGSFYFEAQYQQRPVPETGNLINWTWFQVYDHLPNQGPHDQIVQSWDTASKAGELNDFSVCSTWLITENTFYLIDVLRARLDYPSLRRRAIETRDRFNAHAVLIEDKGSGTSLIQDLARSGEIHPIKIEPEGDKVTRMATQAAKIEAGQARIPREAPWLDEFRSEILAFPYGRHDDQVDSLSQFLGWVDQRQRFSFQKAKLGGL